MLLLTYKCKIPNLILLCIHVNNRVYLFPLAYNKYFSLTVFTVSDTFFFVIKIIQLHIRVYNEIIL